MISDLREFVRALSAMLRALALLLVERSREARRLRRVAEYNEQVRRGVSGLFSENSDELSVAWGSLDDKLRGEGIAPDLDGGTGGDRSPE